MAKINVPNLIAQSEGASRAMQKLKEIYEAEGATVIGDEVIWPDDGQRFPEGSYHRAEDDDATD